MYKQAYTDRVIGVNMSDLAAASHVQYGTKPFKAILFSLFLAGNAIVPAVAAEFIKVVMEFLNFG